MGGMWASTSARFSVELLVVRRAVELDCRQAGGSDGLWVGRLASL